MTTSPAPALVPGSLQASIAAAKEAAAMHTAHQMAAVPDLHGPGLPSQGYSAGRAAPISMADLVVGSLNVDEWLKVKEFGLLIGADSQLVSELLVDIDMNAVQPNYCIKFGNPAQYFKTYDRITCASGGTWDDAIARARRVDPSARDYRSADLPMTLVGKVRGFPAGTRLGHSLSTTNWSEFVDFYEGLLRRGLANACVRVMLGFKARSNTKANRWGVVTFTLAAAREGQTP